MTMWGRCRYSNRVNIGVRRLAITSSRGHFLPLDAVSLRRRIAGGAGEQIGAKSSSKPIFQRSAVCIPPPLLAVSTVVPRALGRERPFTQGDARVSTMTAPVWSLPLLHERRKYGVVGFCLQGLLLLGLVVLGTRSVAERKFGSLLSELFRQWNRLIGLCVDYV